MRASIRWLKPEQGGKDAPPAGHQYSTVARFSHQKDDEWVKNAWSLVLDLEGAADLNWVQFANIRFLSPEGPTSWLAHGAHFSLFEGRRKVAEGEVL